MFRGFFSAVLRGIRTRPDPCCNRVAAISKRFAFRQDLRAQMRPFAVKNRHGTIQKRPMYCCFRHVTQATFHGPKPKFGAESSILPAHRLRNRPFWRQLRRNAPIRNATAKTATTSAFRPPKAAHDRAKRRAKRVQASKAVARAPSAAHCARIGRNRIRALGPAARPGSCLRVGASLLSLVA